MITDFPSLFWPITIALITIAGILGCLILLFLTGQKKINSKKVSTTHVWDETLTEKNNPLPKWWVNLFIITIIFSIAYLFFYPGLIITQGSYKWTQNNQYDREMASANEKYSEVYKKYAALSADDYLNNRKAVKVGKKLFLNQCAECHGVDAKGSMSFPNLTDNDWLYGGDLKSIRETITNGRNGMMPAFKQSLNPNEVTYIAHYVNSLSGGEHQEHLAYLGKPMFKQTCSVCHSDNATGNQIIGAPNLTDDIWLHGKGIEFIMSVINNGIVNHMPPRNTRLSKNEIDIVSMYVWTLSKANQ